MQNDFQAILLNERKKIMSVYRSTRFTQLSKDVVHTQIIPFATYSPWENDEAFITTYDKIKGHTLVDIYRCYELWDIARQVARLRGDVIEVGVWKGGTGALIAAASAANAESTVYLCDTFEGVVKAGENDTNYKGGEHADTSEQLVTNLLEELKLKNVSICKGIFPDDHKDQFSGLSFKFSHIDVDTYASAKDIFDFVWPRTVTGGAVAFDDYGIWGCEGVTKLVNEMQIADGFKIYNINGHSVIIKLGK